MFRKIEKLEPRKPFVFYLRLQIDVPWWWHVMTRRSKTQMTCLDFWWRNIFPKRNNLQKLQSNRLQKTRWNTMNSSWTCMNLLVSILFGSNFQPTIQPKKKFAQKLCWFCFLLESGQKPSKNHGLTPGGLPRRCASWAHGDVSPWRLNPSKALRLGDFFWQGNGLRKYMIRDMVIYEIWYVYIWCIYDVYMMYIWCIYDVYMMYIWCIYDVYDVYKDITVQTVTNGIEIIRTLQVCVWCLGW